MAKVISCFECEPDVASKGAEKAFVAFAERITKEWNEEAKRASYGDDWFKTAVAKFILFRASESIVSKADWYEGGYRAQIVAYSCARLARLATDLEAGGFNYLKVWNQQSIDTVLEEQLSVVAQRMAAVLQSPPLAGQNISEWAKQQACRRTALETSVETVDGFEEWLSSGEEKRSKIREGRRTRRVDDSLDALKQVLEYGALYWNSIRDFGRSKRILEPDDEKALVAGSKIPNTLPNDRQAARLIALVDRAREAGWKG